jgi:transposase InsO family protein
MCTIPRQPSARGRRPRADARDAGVTSQALARSAAEDGNWMRCERPRCERDAPSEFPPRPGTLTTGCDAASSFTWAQLVVGDVTAGDVGRFVDTTIRPAYRAAGWSLQRVLTDGGHEFIGRFVEGCDQRGIRVTRTKSRHAWTNGFVEPVQGTILHEHWRIAFRRHYFTSRVALQRALDRYLRFYNDERPLRGDRLKGLTPAIRFAGEMAA